MTEQILWRLAGSLIWVMAVAILLVKTHQSARLLYRLQALGEAGLLSVIALDHEPLLWIDVIMVLLIKEIAIPKILGPQKGMIARDYGAKGTVGMTFLLFVAAAFTLGGLALGQVPGLLHPLVAGVLLGAWFVSFMHLSSRYETWSMSWALLSLDTISGALAVAVAGPIPEFAGVGIDVGALVVAVLLALLTRTIASTLHTTDVRDVEELIG